MERIMKPIIALVVCIILLVFMLKSCTTSISNKITEETEKIESYIGKEFVLNSDTLMIIDYSLLNETFTLSNGTEVHYKLIMKP